MIKLLLIAAIQLSDMSPLELKATGVEQLSQQQKNALQSWLDTRLAQKKSKQKPAVLQENLQGGRYIRLSDHTTWEIHPDDSPITQLWITPVEITVEPSDQSDYPYKLTNSLTGSSVRAKKIAQVPPASTPKSK